MPAIDSFEELAVWQSAHELRKQISNLAKSFPFDERFRLVDQIVRSSRSITANIAEGFGRFHYKDNLKYCYQPRGSLTETLEHLICALDDRYISQSEFDKNRALIDDCLKKLNGYIAYLSRAQGAKNSQ